jgi:hypothetical protein
MNVIFAAGGSVGYNPGMRETKTARVNAMLKPSVKKHLEEVAAALRLSEADALAEAIKRTRQAKDVRDALAKSSHPASQEEEE